MSSSRRQFIRSLLGAGSVWSLAPAFPSLWTRAAWAIDRTAAVNDRVLVVLQLSGGNDGLNTVVPYADDAYGRSRTTLRLTQRDVVRIDDYLGFHPELTQLKELHDEGLLTVVQGVGHANNDRDHEAAMREWHSARPGDRDAQTGWIGRTVDWIRRAEPIALPAAFVGPIVPPFALNAERSAVASIAAARQWVREPAWEPLRGGEAEWSGEGSGEDRARQLLETVRRGVAGADRLSRQVDSVLASATANDDYPPFGLARQLRDVSLLIQADLGVRIYCVELGGGGDGIGGFDNHANQRDNHAALLRELSASVHAFVRDLRRCDKLSQVVLMTFSEFGRTLGENGRRGTDHGAAAPVLLAGGALRGGIHGDHPALTNLQGDSPEFLIDYRRMYATLLRDWLGLDAKAILDQDYPSIDVWA